MAYTIISQNNTTTTLADENGNVITVPARVTLATSTDYTITKVNNNSVDLVDGNGKVIRGVPACVVLAGGGGGGDQHNLGWYATQVALEEAHPTAEAGDWAIVGATDTVWIWDTDNNEWVDSDQKGQVTSVNNQTGAVTVSEVPSQTGNAGKFLTTDGTDASWSNKLKNQLVVSPSGAGTYTKVSVLKLQTEGAGNGVEIKMMPALNHLYLDNVVHTSAGFRPETDSTVSLGATGMSWSHIFTKRLNAGLGSGHDITVPDTEGTMAVQVSTVPTASASNEGCIVQYTGTTDANYTNGYFYKCVSDGLDPATYSWTQTNVQPAPSGLPDQTGQSGKFLTTDGTDASWSDKPLVNESTGTYSLSIKGGEYSGTKGVLLGNAYEGTGRFTSNNVYCIGASISGSSNISNAFIAICPSLAISYIQKPGAYSVCVGGFASGQYSAAFANGTASGSQSTAINAINGTASGAYSIIIGSNTSATADGAIQIGGASQARTNSDANTFKVGNANGNFEIMSADGTVPTARLTKVNTTATLAVADWSSSTQTVTVSGVKADSVVFVSPAPASASDYASAGILCTAQAADSLTFTCTTTPTNAITVNVVCM